MKYDEFAFFNQQLAAMLRDGMPLEGALRQLCQSMRKGSLRAELEHLEADLKNGTPINNALAARKLPEFYVQMVQIGVKSNDLPAMLMMLADYYQRADSTWTRLKGLLVYPLIILITAFGLSCFMTVLFRELAGSTFFEIMGIPMPSMIVVAIWGPPVLIGSLLATFLFCLFVPAVARMLRWRLPAFKEAELAQVAAAMALMLKSGGNLNDALGLVQQLERGTPASAELGGWRQHLAEGRGKFAEMAESGRAFPPLFLWLVGNAGEDLAGGFQRAAEIYGARAVHRSEMFLYAAMPSAVLLLGAMVACQVFPVVKTFTSLLNGIGS
jgi:type II secretory pathway component PulF